MSEYSQYPEYLNGKEEIGPYPRINIEKVASLRPDLVLASSEYNLPDQIEQLKRLKLPDRILPAEKFSEMSAWILNLGEVLQEPKGALQAKNNWEEGIKALQLKRKQHLSSEKRILIEVQHSPLISVGGASFLNEAFLLVGDQNVFKDLKQAYPKVSKEAVLKENPDAIFILTLMGQENDFKTAADDWKSFPSLLAVKNHEIHSIPADDFARCSLRLLKALKQL